MAEHAWRCTGILSGFGSVEPRKAASHMTVKPRILYIAWTPPSADNGACLAMRRHLIERKDFETFVLTNERFSDSEIRSHCFLRPAWLERAMRTRFRRFIRQFEMLFLGRWMLTTALKLASEFKPDLVFTIPDNDVSWCAYLTTQRLKLPLVTNFQDWWPHNLYWSESERPYPRIRRVIERRLRQMYAASAIAFCSSEGMKEFLGPHANAVTLFPCPGRPPANVPAAAVPRSSKPLRVLYAGTIVGDYGRSVLSLARQLAGSSKFEFVVYGRGPDWSLADISWAKAQGIYRGFIPHEQLRAVLARADAFLTIMSFEHRSEIMSRVSFTTKFLEYTQYGRPVVVWGPPYCQPVLVAKKTLAGLPVESSDPAAVVSALEQLTSESEYKRLAEGAIRAAETFFAPDNIHEVFKASILKTIQKTKDLLVGH
jgi:glycosyltransferase involved in cell wall biosynthesis